MLETDPLLQALGILDLRHQHVHGIDIGGGADLRDHDEIQPRAGLFDHVHDVAIHVVRVEAVDSDRHGFLAPVDLVQRLDDVLARLRLVVRRDCVLEVEEDHVGFGSRSLFKHLRGAARNRQLTPVKSGGGLLNDVEGHLCAPCVLGIWTGP